MHSPVERLKLIRRNLNGISQAKLSKKLGIPSHKIKDVESGKTKISVEMAEIIEEKLNYSFRWILTGKGKMIRPNEIGEPEPKDFTDNPQIAKLLSMTRAVLNSGTQYANSLDANIRSFHHAMQIESRFNSLENVVASLENEVAAINSHMANDSRKGQRLKQERNPPDVIEYGLGKDRGSSGET